MFAWIRVLHLGIMLAAAIGITSAPVHGQDAAGTAQPLDQPVAADPVPPEPAATESPDEDEAPPPRPDPPVFQPASPSAGAPSAPAEAGATSAPAAQVERRSRPPTPAPQPVAGEPLGDPLAVEAESVRPGASLHAGVMFDYARILYTATTSGADEYVAHGGAITMGIAGGVDYGFNEVLFIGLRFQVGRILNSDDSSGNALHVGIGPSLTAFVAKSFYLGLDLLAEYWSFDDLSPSYGGNDDFSAQPERDELDGEAVGSLSAAVRLGVLIELSEKIGISGELRLHSTFFNFAQTETDVFIGEMSESNDAEDIYVPGASLTVGVRTFL